MAIHIGNIIHGLVDKKGLKAKAVADFVNISESTLYKIYKKTSIDIEKIIRFSQLLDENLFLCYMKEEPLRSMFGKQVISLQNQVMSLEKDNEHKDNKIKGLEEMIEMQRKVISLHEDKSKRLKK